MNGKARKAIEAATNSVACPYCGARALTTLPASSVLAERTGCLVCNVWLSRELPIQERKQA